MRTGRAIFPTMLAVAVALGVSGQVQAASPSPAAGQSAPSSATGQPAAEGFPTPEDAIREYLAGVAQGDASRYWARAPSMR